MKIVFAGTPDFSVPTLQALLDSGHEVVAVYTQPDRPAGRGRKLRASPVKELALAEGVPVFQPATLRDEAAQTELAALQPDLMVVVAYGLLLPQVVLDTPRLGCVNVHASLLPRWRGAAPIQRAIIEGDARTGVTLMQMEAGLDTGPMLAKAALEIGAEETSAELHDRLSALGGELMRGQLEALLGGALPAEVQDDQQANYARKLSKAEAELDWSRPAAELVRRINGLNPWPVAQTGFRGKTLRIWRARLLDADAGAAPGCILRAGSEGVDVACGSGSLRLLEVQLPGARRVAAADFANAQDTAGVCLAALAADAHASS